jgi:hypothetical protein
MVAFTTITQGSSSQIMEPRHVVVRTADQWQTLWKGHSSQPAPVVQFSQSVVVGVFLGSRPTAGFQVEITAVKAQGGLAVVEYVERQPGRGAVVAQVLTSPFHLVALPRDVDTIEFRRIELPRG